jgi:hypothetical protein
MASVKDQHCESSSTSRLPIQVPSGGVVPYRVPVVPTLAHPRLIIVLGLLVIFILLGSATLLGVNAWYAHQSATITVLPTYTIEKRQITLSLVSTQPTTGSQVSARILTTMGSAQTATVPATGTHEQSSQVAMGEILFLNIAPYAQDVPAGSVLTASNGIQIQTLAQAQIPAGNAPKQGMATVPARAIDPGAAGNIPAYALNNVQCCDTGTIPGVVAENPRPFTGGQDAENYSFVQQTDIITASAPLIQQQRQAGQAALRSRLRPDEQLAGDITCTPSVRSNVAPGVRTATVQVTVETSCRSEVYSREDARRKATALWSSQVKREYGTAYRTGQIEIGVGTTSSQQGTLTLTLPVRGVVFYQVDRTALQRSLSQIAGKSPKEAELILLHIAGVSRATITGTQQNALPVDPAHITFVISVPTLSTHV